MRSIRPLSLAAMLVLLALALPCLAQEAPDAPLTNADVVKMVKAGLPSSVIVSKIQTSPNNFSTSTAALIQLKKQGASEDVLHAVMDGNGAPAGYAPPPPGNDGAQHATTINLHHMPSFEANVRVSDKKTEKIIVGKNHLEVKQSGVPLFSLKWKDPGEKGGN